MAGAVAAGAALILALLVAAALAALAPSTSAAPSGSGGPGIWQLGGWLNGLAFGAPLVAHAGGSASPFLSGTLGVSLHLPVPLILLVACVLAAALTRRSQRVRPVTEPAAALAAAGLSAVVPFVLGLLVSLTSTASTASASSGLVPLQAAADLGTGHFRSGFYPALILFAVTLVARLAAGGIQLPAVLHRLELGGPARAVGDYLLLTAALTSTVALAAGLVELPSAGAAVGLWALTLPGLGVLGTQLAAFAPLQVSGWSAGSLNGSDSLASLAGSSGGSGSAAGSTSFSLYGGAVPAWWSLMLLVPVVGIAVAGIRHTLRRPPTARAPWAAAGWTALLLVLSLLALNAYLSVGGSVSGQASVPLLGGAAGGGFLGVSVGPLGYLCAAVVGGLIPLVGWLLAPILYRAAPQLLRAALHVPVPSRQALAGLDSGSPDGAGTGPPAPVPWAQPESAPVWSTAAIPPFSLPQSAAQPPPALPERRRTTPMAIALACAAVVLAAVVGVVVGRASGRPTPQAAERAAATTSLGRASASPPSSTDPGAGQTEDRGYSSAAPTTPDYPTVSAGGIDLREVAADPSTPQIARTLDTYFEGVNAHDGAQAASVFAPSGAIDPGDPAQVAKFQHDISTTTDEQVVVHSIQPDPSDVGGYLVAVSFRSRQDPSFGPGGAEGCTDWSLTYQVTGQFQLLRTQGAGHTAC